MDSSELSSKEAWHWLQRGEMNKEIEEMLMAAQDQALRTS